MPARDVVAALADPSALESLPALTVVGVDGASASELASLAARPPTPLVVVGVASEPETLAGPAHGCDVLLTEADAGPSGWVRPGEGVDGALANLAAIVAACPQAATTMAQVLRIGEALDVAGGLVLESLAYSTLQAGPEHGRWLATRPPTRPRRLAPGPPIALERLADRLLVRFERPAVRNAYDAATRDALAEALTLALLDDAVADVELSGAGPAFCAGGDLDEFGTTPDPATAHVTRTARSPGRLLAALGARTTARVHGACVGAGTELAAFCGRVIARPGTWFALPEVAMGLVPGAGGTVSVARRIGRQRTAWMALTGVRLPVDQALAWGLVDEIDATDERDEPARPPPP